MANPVILIAGTCVTVTAIIGSLLGFYGIVPFFVWLSPLLYATSVMLFLTGIGLRHPIAIIVIFVVTATFLEGVAIDHWFGLPGFL